MAPLFVSLYQNRYASSKKTKRLYNVRFMSVSIYLKDEKYNFGILYLALCNAQHIKNTFAQKRLVVVKNVHRNFVCVFANTNEKILFVQF